MTTSRAPLSSLTENPHTTGIQRERGGGGWGGQGGHRGERERGRERCSTHACITHRGAYVCMCVCVYVYMCICIHIPHTHIHMYTCIHTCTHRLRSQPPHTHARTHMFTRVRARIQQHTHTHTHTHTHSIYTASNLSWVQSRKRRYSVTANTVTVPCQPQDGPLYPGKRRKETSQSDLRVCV